METLLLATLFVTAVSLSERRSPELDSALARLLLAGNAPRHGPIVRRGDLRLRVDDALQRVQLRLKGDEERAALA
jgi:hypothetical protein